MPEQLKYIYNQEFFAVFTSDIKKVLPQFKPSDFTQAIFNPEWEAMELKQRMRHISLVLHQFLDADYPKGVKQLLDILQYSKTHKEDLLGFEYMFFPDYVEVFGLDYFDESVQAMEEITKYTSCEFAIRPFFIKYPQETLKQMEVWSTHSHAMVRRLSTEGCRPRLPWAMALPAFKKDPNSILPILKCLRNDESESVRRSVANNLNDISKDNPEIMFQLVKQWKGESKEVDWVVKHACRTLLKQGVPEVMTLFGYGSAEDIKVGDIVIQTPKVKIGEALTFDFTLKNTSNQTNLVRLEYGLYFMKANGSLSKKVFKISERPYQPDEEVRVSRNQSFKVITTRKLYPGEHQVAVIVNGTEFKAKSFLLEQ